MGDFARWFDYKLLDDTDKHTVHFKEAAGLSSCEIIKCNQNLIKMEIEICQSEHYDMIITLMQLKLH